jgi:hypothetical protein
MPFENEEDVHRLTAALIFGKPPEEISDKDGSSPIGGGGHSERFWGKNLITVSTTILDIKTSPL